MCVQRVLSGRSLHPAVRALGHFGALNNPKYPLCVLKFLLREPPSCLFRQSFCVFFGEACTRVGRVSFCVLVSVSSPLRVIMSSGVSRPF